MTKKKIAAFGPWSLWWIGQANGWTRYHLRHKQRRVGARLPKVAFWIAHNGKRFAWSYELGALRHGQPALYRRVRDLIRMMS